MSSSDVTAMVLTIIRSDLAEFMPLLAGLTAVSYVVLLLLRFINPANK